LIFFYKYEQAYGIKHQQTLQYKSGETKSRIHTPKPSNQNNLYIRYMELRIRVQKKMYPNVLWLHMAWCSKSKLLLFYNYIFFSSTSK